MVSVDIQTKSALLDFYQHHSQNLLSKFRRKKSKNVKKVVFFVNMDVISFQIIYPPQCNKRMHVPGGLSYD